MLLHDKKKCTGCADFLSKFCKYCWVESVAVTDHVVGLVPFLKKCIASVAAVECTNLKTEKL